MHTALILAAGFGSRLKPITDTLPKALVPVNGLPLLEILINKLIGCGFKKIIINTHYLSELVEAFIKNKNFPVEIILSHEDDILGTGGGIKKIQQYIDEDNFLVHNVDVISTIDLEDLISFHQKNQPLATMVMQKRETANRVLVDSENNFCGMNYIKKEIYNLVKAPRGDISEFGFCGIHIINRKIFDYFSNEHFFSIIETYLSAVERGENILAYKLSSEQYWKDVGTIKAIKEAEEFLRIS